MCGRFTFTRGEVDDLARELAAEVERAGSPVDPLSLRPRYNVAPSQPHWILRLGEGGQRLLSTARFGLARARGGLQVNARGETAARSRAFARAFAEARCVVPVDGFYEWRRGPGGARPFWLHRPGGALMLLAGLWAEEERGRAFAILTTAASAEVAPLHDRMPALLSQAEAERWLSDGDGALLRPAADGSLSVEPVSPRVNSVANDGPELLRPPEPERQLGLW